MKNRIAATVALTALMSVPALAIAWQAAQPDLWLADLLHPTGEWSARLLIVVLMLTPLSLVKARRGLTVIFLH